MQARARECIPDAALGFGLQNLRTYRRRCPLQAAPLISLRTGQGNPSMKRLPGEQALRISIRDLDGEFSWKL